MLEGAATAAVQVSVVIPSHNDLATLPDAVASVRAQTLAAYECIVVSDASDDGTEAWLESQAGVRWRAITARSPSAARNAGLEMASAPFVAFLDADDVWHPGRLALFAHQLAARPEGAIWACTWRREGLPLAPLPSDEWVARHCRRISPDAFLHMNQFQTSTVVARAEALHAVGGFDPKADGAEDWDLWTRLSRVGPVWLTQAPLVTYRTGTGRVSSDGGRVYRQGLGLLARQGADSRRVAWHHLRFAYAFRRQGKEALAQEANAAMPPLGVAAALLLRLRFGLYLGGRMVRRAIEAVSRRLGR
jgi:glycosyltransferase involved in cell wall biosynthesis